MLTGSSESYKMIFLKIPRLHILILLETLELKNDLSLRTARKILLQTPKLSDSTPTMPLKQSGYKLSYV